MVFSQEKVQKYYPGAYMIPAMKVAGFTKERQHMKKEILNSEEYFAEEKIDGNFYMLEKTEKGNYLFSRNTSKVTGLLTEKGENTPHLFEELSFLPNNTVLVGEIAVGDKFKEVRTIMGCKKDRAIQRQKQNGWVLYYPFDILVYDGEEIYNKWVTLDRVKFLRELIEKNSEQTPHIKTLKMSTEKNKEQFLEEIFQEGKEGIVLKKINGIYHPDQRKAWEWMRIKKEDQHDVIAIDFNEPVKEYSGKEINKWEYWEGDTPVTKPYYFGWIGSIQMGVYYSTGEIVNIGSVSSGLSEKVLEEIKQSPNDYLFKPMKIKSMETTEDYKLREPSFIEFRDDIDIQDCTWDKIFK